MENEDDKVGRILKERREELGYTIQDAEQATRIRKTYLQSLENNSFSELPGRAYVTGFIRVYARYLGLQSNPLLALLNDLQNLEPGPHDTMQTVRTQPARRTVPAPDGDWRKFFLAFILVVVLGCCLYFLPGIFFNEEPLHDGTTSGTASGGDRSASAEPQAGLERSQAEPADTQTDAAGRTEPREAVDVTDARETVPSAVGAKHQEMEHRTLPVIPRDGASLRMLALADSSLIIKLDARKAHSYKLYDGLDLTWKIKQRVNVEFAAVDVARFWLNGQEIDLAGCATLELIPADE